MENNVDKAIDYGTELYDEVVPLLDQINGNEMRFSLATAHSLKCEEIDTAIGLYKEALTYDQEVLDKYPQLSQFMGIVKNNLGITHFFKFIELSNMIPNQNDVSPNMV